MERSGQKAHSTDRGKDVYAILVKRKGRPDELMRHTWENRGFAEMEAADMEVKFPENQYIVMQLRQVPILSIA